jgi:hypothetical protein
MSGPIDFKGINKAALLGRRALPERSRLFEPFPNRGWRAVEHGQGQWPI